MPRRQPSEATIKAREAYQAERSASKKENPQRRKVIAQILVKDFLKRKRIEEGKGD